MIGLHCCGICLPIFLLAQTFRFRPSGSSSTAPMSFLHEWLLWKSCTLGLPFFSLPSFRRAGWRWAVSGCPCVASRGFSSPPARLGPAGGVDEPLVARSVHASLLLSPRFIRGLGIQELLSCGGLLLPVLSRLVLPPHLYTLGEVMGRERLREFSRLPLPPHLCTLGELVRRVRPPSAAPVRVLPGLPIFGSGGREGSLSPLLVGCLSCAVLLLTLSLCLPCSVRRSGRCGRGSSHCVFPLCGRGAIVGGLPLRWRIYVWVWLVACLPLLREWRTATSQYPWCFVHRP